MIKGPAGHRVRVKIAQVEEKSTGGIILSTEVTAKMNQKAVQESIVDAVGRSAFKDFGDGHAWAEVGDKVLIARHSGEDRPEIVDGEETGYLLRIINDVDILEILEDVNDKESK